MPRSRLPRQPRPSGALLAPRPRREPSAWVELDDGTRLAAYVTEPSAPPAAGAVGAGAGGAGAAPVVVLAHGWTLTAAAWDRTVERLATRRPDVRVVRYDQRGHGASQASPATSAERASSPAASIRGLGDDLARVVAELAPPAPSGPAAASPSASQPPPTPLVLAGHSMGGMAVLAAARGHPQLLAGRPCGVLLCSTSAGGLSAGGRPLAPIMAALAALPANVLVPRAPARLAQRVGYGPGVDPALVRTTMRAMGPVSGRTTGEWFAALMAHDETAALPALAAAGAAVRVVVGDADRMTPVEHARALADGLPDAVLTVVPGAGHMLFVERPDVVVDEIVALLGAG